MPLLEPRYHFESSNFMNRLASESTIINSLISNDYGTNYLQIKQIKNDHISPKLHNLINAKLKILQDHLFLANHELIIET